MADSLPSSCAVVCHDAGAANVIFAWLDADQGKRHRIYASGPAARLRAASADIACESIEEALANASMLLSGTGWSSDVEHRARKLARCAGVKSVAVLDHWVNYRERFVRDGETVLPDELWVTDEYALDIARANFPGAIVELKPNLYVARLLREIADAGPPDAAEVLFVLEPMRSDFGRGTAGEFQALDYFVEALPRLRLPASIRLRLRPHPSDAPGKYEAWARAHPDLNAGCSDPSETLSRAIGRAGTVVGCNTQALAVAVQAGRRVVCALPPWAPPCVLPFPQIEALAPR
jgi:hypothetical protein